MNIDNFNDAIHLRRIYVSGFQSSSLKTKENTERIDVHDDMAVPTTSQLQQIFQRHGTIESIDIIGGNDNHMKHKQKKRSRCDMQQKQQHRLRKPFAFVTFESKQSVEQILRNVNDDGGKNIDTDVADADLSCSIIKRCHPKKKKVIKRHRSGHEEMQNTLLSCGGGGGGDNANGNVNGTGTNLILQIHRSHLHRMTEYIENMNKRYERKRDDGGGVNENEHGSLLPPPPPPPKLVGTASPSSRPRISFVFLRTQTGNGSDETSSEFMWEAANYWINYFSHHAILTRFALNKVYMADTLTTIPHNMPEKEKADLLTSTALTQLTQRLSRFAYEDTNDNDAARDVILKVQVFPPKPFQRAVVASLDAQMDAVEARQEAQDESSSSIPEHIQTLAHDPRIGLLSMSTAEYTHTLSCVQLFCPISSDSNTSPQETLTSTKDCNLTANDGRKELYMIGILPRVNEKENAEDEHHRGEDDNDSSEICRAYYKLQEAMELFRADEQEKHKNINVPTLNFVGKTAFDCGSSPGGWTKYLVEKEGCRKVYSCDPGLLDPSILAMDQVQHLKMRGEDAMDWIVEQKNNDENDGKEMDKVNLWVSDMCLLDPSHQVDHFLRALEKGVLATHQYNEQDSDKKEKCWVFFVLTLKFNTGHARKTFDDMARLEVQRLKERLEEWAMTRHERNHKNLADDPKMNEIHVRTYHLFSNRKGERTIMGRFFV